MHPVGRVSAAGQRPILSAHLRPSSALHSAQSRGQARIICSMDTPKTAGQKVRAALDKLLDPGMAWDESELLTLAAIERAADRLAVFQTRFEVFAADPKSSPPRLAALSGEIRLLDGAIQKGWRPRSGVKVPDVGSARLHL